MTEQELAAFIASKIDAESFGDWDIEARSDGDDTVAVWVDHQTKDEGTTFLITVSNEAV